MEQSKIEKYIAYGKRGSSEIIWTATTSEGNKYQLKWGKSLDRMRINFGEFKANGKCFMEFAHRITNRKDESKPNIAILLHIEKLWLTKLNKTWKYISDTEE